MRASANAWLLELRVRIPPGVWLSVSCECCLLSGRGLCVGLITCPEESYRTWCVWVWSWSLDNGTALSLWGLLRNGKKRFKFPSIWFEIASFIGMDAMMWRFKADCCYVCAWLQQDGAGDVSSCGGQFHKYGKNNRGFSAKGTPPWSMDTEHTVSRLKNYHLARCYIVLQLTVGQGPVSGYLNVALNFWC
jgi:hypothetical protein